MTGIIDAGSGTTQLQSEQRLREMGRTFLSTCRFHSPRAPSARSLRAVVRLLKGDVGDRCFAAIDIGTLGLPRARRSRAGTMCGLTIRCRNFWHPRSSLGMSLTPKEYSQLLRRF